MNAIRSPATATGPVQNLTGSSRGAGALGEAVEIRPSQPNRREHSYRLRRVAYANYRSDYLWSDPSWAGPFNPAWDNDGRHSRGNNIAYADGHAKWVAVSKTTIDLFGVDR